MDEIIDIVDEQCTPTGKTALKSVIHSNGYYHNTVHLWLYTSSGHILLAQRAASKLIYPLLWDVSVAGHVDAGETLPKAAVREAQEELGLSLSENALYKIGVFKSFQSYPNGIIDNEFNHTFIAKLNIPISALNIQKEEVESIKLVSFNSFSSYLKNSKNTNYFVASNHSYYQFVLNSIKHKVENHIK